jgi:uncharacterized protein (TIGR03435 family)
VHYETRPRDAYRLVFARADRRLGPQLKPSTCESQDPRTAQESSVAARDAMLATIRDRRPATPQEEAVLLSQCRGSFNAWNTIYSGGLNIESLILSLQILGRLDRPIVDATGLTGFYSIKLWAAPPPVGPAAPSSTATPSDAPSVFTALPEQLGLKLEPVTIDGEVLVIDHIERPTEN